jgi:hypothetical protein
MYKGIMVYDNPESSNANVRGNTIIRLYTNGYEDEKASGKSTFNSREICDAT